MNVIRLTIALALWSAACAPARAQLPEVTLATPLAVSAVSTFIAREKGYFRDAGVEVKIEPIDSLTRVIALVATNRIQMAQGAINASLFNAVGQGLPVIMTLGSGATPVYHNIVIRKAIKDEIRSVSDLRGRNIAVAGVGSGSVYEIASVLEGAGMRLSDINIKPLSFQQMTTSLANGSIDGALMYSPFSDYTYEQGIAVPWIDPEDGYMKVLPATSLAWVASADWVRQNREIAGRVTQALVRAGREYCQAYHHGPNRGELIEAMIRHGIATDRNAIDKVSWQARDPNGAFSRDSILDIQRVFRSEGFVEKETSYEKLIDASFSADAAKALGPFELINKASKLHGCR